jgi:hypothetical protein
MTDIQALTPPGKGSLSLGLNFLKPKIALPACRLHPENVEG